MSVPWNDLLRRDVGNDQRGRFRSKGRFLRVFSRVSIVCESANSRGNSTKAAVILIVEDESLVRLFAVETVTNAGFEAIEAANADEAIWILERRNDIRAVFTDIQIPGSMDGLKLAHAVRNRWPPIKIIVTSGLLQITEQDLPEGGRFFAKPYDPIQIRDTLREWSL
jgi:CheY-like chemotaxis protein